MYKMVPWSIELDLEEFYLDAANRGFYNNSSQQVMIDAFNDEKEMQAWILYYNSRAVGSVVAHSMDEGYRICARTCTLTDLLDIKYSNNLRTKSVITEHQNPTAQFFIPAAIDWVNNRGDMFITTHPSDVGKQKRVHNTWGPLLVETGCLSLAFQKDYRGHFQTFWKLNTEVFLEQLNKYPRWA